jgi:hypothetical protein
MWSHVQIQWHDAVLEVIIINDIGQVVSVPDHTAKTVSYPDEYAVNRFSTESAV